jgi:apolipoprotein N-acyltransferase
VKSALVKPEPTPIVRPATAPPWYRTTGVLALASSLLLWLPLSPLGWSALAWVAPIGWLLLIRQEKLPGKRPYALIYLAGLVHWLLVMEGVRRAYWALYFGWLALGAYLAIYLVLFIGLSRIAVHRLKVPLWIAAPTVWVGLEILRSYALTGFPMALLGHTQSGLTPVIQIADLGGAYAVSFFVMFVAACLAHTAPWWFGRWQWRPAVALAAGIALVLGYGYWRLGDAAVAHKESAGKSLKVVLLQNSIDTIFDGPPERQVQTYRAYYQQAREAAHSHPDTQLMIWPESVFASSYYDYVADADAAPPREFGGDPQQFARQLEAAKLEADAHVKTTVQGVNVRNAQGSFDHQIAHVVGWTTVHFRADKTNLYNSALLVSPGGNVRARYSKAHLVMFGEYIPLGEMFPFIYRWTPMPAGLSRGQEAAVFEVAGHKLAPSICFESTVPHFIRRQVRELDAQGESPDMLVNLTNDGWFWGSGVLDLHYHCAIFRAVEHRRPMLVAANTGFSTAVDPAGRVLAVGPRRQVETLAVDVPAYRMASPYTRFGDLFAFACLAFTAVCASVGIWKRGRKSALAPALQ